MLTHVNHSTQPGSTVAAMAKSAPGRELSNFS